MTAMERSDAYDRQAWNTLNDRFHGALYAATDCASLRRPIEALSAQANRIRAHFDVRPGTVDDEHQAILDACRAGAADTAARAAQAHILQAHLRAFPRAGIAPGSALAVAVSLAGLDAAARPRPS
jgi:DNA-binding GntR family transcriptional regulator